MTDSIVTSQIVQSSDMLGKMDVALFDENMQIVMSIYWRDAWVESQKGYFGVTYFPEGGSAVGCSSGYIYMSFLRTGRIWYEDGNIKYEIEQPGRVQTGDLGPAGNPYRLIKYVVVRPSRSGSFSLVDMRIRQISVTSGCRVPTEKSVDCPVPVKTAQQVEKDGTIKGKYSASDDGLSTEIQQFANNAITCDWLPSFWPTIQIAVNAVYYSCSFVLLLTIDILGSANIIDTDFAVEGADFNKESTANRIAQYAEAAQYKASHSGDNLKIATAAVIITSWLAINWWTFPLFVVALACWHIAMAIYLWELCNSLALESITVADAGYSLLATVFSAAATLGGYFVKKSILVDKVLQSLEKIVGKVVSMVMNLVKWMLIISSIVWILIMIRLIGGLFYEYPLSDIFESIMLQSTPL